MSVSEQKPPSDLPKTPPAQAKVTTNPPVKPAAAKAPSGRRDSLSGVEDKLNEMFGAVAVGQMGLAVMTGDHRHQAGAEVTSHFGPALSSAWVNLARENDAVKRVLIRMSEGTAWGAVVATSAGFLYSQAQAYNAVPRQLPNPWVQLVPESNEDSPDRNVQATTTGPDSPAKTDDAVTRAEAERRAVEERRKTRGS